MALQAGNLAPYYLVGHFIFAYAVLSTRGAKNYLKLDHNVNPRQDVTKYGQQAVTKGKLTQRQLNFLQRNEACHANSTEHYPVFAAAVLFATTTLVDVGKINYMCAIYTMSRVVYAVAYFAFESHGLSYIRSLAWWSGNFACLNLLWAAGKALNP